MRGFQRHSVMVCRMQFHGAGQLICSGGHRGNQDHRSQPCDQDQGQDRTDTPTFTPTEIAHIADVIGFHPVQAESAATALELLEAGVEVDLLLTDIVMPGGIDCRELANKARGLRPDLPVVFLSGYPAIGDDGQEVSWETLGIKVLAKPVSQVALGEHILKSLAPK